MPIYEFACKKCGHEFEELIRGGEQPACPACGQGGVERQMSVPSAHVAGSGRRHVQPGTTARCRINAGRIVGCTTREYTVLGWQCNCHPNN